MESGEGERVKALKCAVELWLNDVELNVIVNCKEYYCYKCLFASLPSYC